MNTLTGCPAGALDWDNCMAWTVGAGTAALTEGQWEAVEVPPV